jgi:hypothetical protein
MKAGKRHGSGVECDDTGKVIFDGVFSNDKRLEGRKLNEETNLWESFHGKPKKTIVKEELRDDKEKTSTKEECCAIF